MKPTRIGVSLALAALMTWLTMSTASAEQVRCTVHNNEEQQRSSARENFVRGQEQANARNYQAALGYFECSFRNRAHPDTLYNIARAAEFTGDFRRALDAWRGYLRLNPDAQDRAQIEDRIRGLERSVQEAAAQPAQPNNNQPAQPTWTPPQNTPAAQPVPQNWDTPSNTPSNVYNPESYNPSYTQPSQWSTYGWYIAGGGLALAVVGIIFATPIILLMADAGSDAFSDPSDLTCAEEGVINDDDTFEYEEVSSGCRTFGWILVGIGGSAILGGALTALIARRTGRRRSASLTPSLVMARNGDVTGATATFRLAF